MLAALQLRVLCGICSALQGCCQKCVIMLCAASCILLGHAISGGPACCSWHAGCLLKALTCHTMQGCYQLFWLFLIIYGAPARISRYHVTSECETMTMLHTDEYAGSTSITLSNVTTTPPYRTLDLCCSGTDCYEGGLYYQGGWPQPTRHLQRPHSALFNGRLEACSQVCMPPGVFLMK